MLLRTDRLLINLKNTLVSNFAYFDMALSKSDISILSFFRSQGYIVSVVHLSLNKYRIYVNNTANLSTLSALKGSLSRSKVNNISAKKLWQYQRSGGCGLFYGPKGYVDVSSSLFYTRKGGVRPVFTSKHVSIF